MPYQFTVSPDFTPDHISSWYIFNTWLQKALGEGIHLELYDDFVSQRAAIQADQVDLIYANPYDAAMLVREKGFMPVVKPRRSSDEAIVAVREDSAVQVVEDLPSDITIATTDDPDVNLICSIMLEPVEIHVGDTRREAKNSYPLVAKAVIQHQADLGFFLAEAYESLTSFTRSQLRPLVVSQIQIIHHALLAGPRLAEKREFLRELLFSMSELPKGAGVLESFGFDGWDLVDDEEMEFMIDLMDTLNYLPA
ncbi:MAG: phosphate/phosphite/phosphonate ABC transporter substrate-binding protein [Gammaproteobacteria bacterium]